MQASFKSHVYPLPTKDKSGLGIHAKVGLNGSIKFGPNSYFIDGIYYSEKHASKLDFINAISIYYPDIDSNDLYYSHRGIRPKVYTNNELFSDLLINKKEKYFICLIGIESPGLTSALAIAKHVIGLLEEL